MKRPPTPAGRVRAAPARCAALASLALLGLARLAPAPVRAAEPPVVVVTTSLIAAAVHDLAGDTVTVQTLMPAGTCPGQFDLEPGQVRQTRAAVLVIRHDLQGFLDARFAAAGVAPGAVIAPSFGGPLTIPENYARFCTAVAEALARRLPALAAPVRDRAAAIRAREAALAGQLRREAAPLAGTPVVAAAYQADFLRWLGLRGVATLPPDDDLPPQVLRAAITSGHDQGAVLVVGNLQNGRRVPAAVADAVGVPVVMLSNFPPTDAAGAYDALLRANLQALRDARAAPPSPRP